MVEPKGMAEFVYGLLRRPLQKQIGVMFPAIKNGTETVKGNQRGSAGALGLSEDEVEVTRRRIEVLGRHREHPLAAYAENPLEDNVSIVLLPQTVEGLWRYVQ